jgi:periplasmic divalent cation tolerance protein
MKTQAIQLQTTVADQADAERFAAALVAQELAACVQVIGPIESTYRWKGKIESSQEWICSIKTTADAYSAAEQAICKLHSYDVPEIIALPIVAGSAGYLEWVAKSVPGS